MSYEMSWALRRARDSAKPRAAAAVEDSPAVQAMVHAIARDLKRQDVRTPPPAEEDRGQDTREARPILLISDLGVSASWRFKTQQEQRR